MKHIPWNQVPLYIFIIVIVAIILNAPPVKITTQLLLAGFCGFMLASSFSAFFLFLLLRQRQPPSPRGVSILYADAQVVRPVKELIETKQ